MQFVRGHERIVLGFRHPAQPRQTAAAAADGRRPRRPAAIGRGGGVAASIGIAAVGGRRKVGGGKPLVPAG